MSYPQHVPIVPTKKERHPRGSCSQNGRQLAVYCQKLSRREGVVKSLDVQPPDRPVPLFFTCASLGGGGVLATLDRHSLCSARVAQLGPHARGSLRLWITVCCRYVVAEGQQDQAKGMPSGGIGDVRAALKVRLLPSVTARLFLGHFWNVPPVGDFVPPNVPPRCPGWGRLFVEACGSETASMLVVVLCFWMVVEPSGSTCGAGGRTRTGTVFSTGRF